MSVPDFLDSNILVYALDADAGAKGERAREIVTAALRHRTAVISFQVVQETLNTIGRKFRRVASPVDCEASLQTVLTPLWTIMPSTALYQRALATQARYGFGFYDSLIVAAALGAGCRRLLSEDLQHGQTIDDLVIENPFLELS